MSRKKWVAQTDITPDLLKAREKRKWQIAFRRYAVEQKPSIPYAPYFGLDIANLRNWLETQFKEGVGWDDFGKKWQFDHVLPVGCFDFELESDLKLCWNFINISVSEIGREADSEPWMALLKAKQYFTSLFSATKYGLCRDMLQKIERLESRTIVQTALQNAFIQSRQSYLEVIADYSAFEFDLLNNGRSAEEVAKEVNFLKKF